MKLPGGTLPFPDKLLDTGRYRVEPSQSGPPSLARIYPDQPTRVLHSLYDPVREADHWWANQNLESTLNFVMYGVGLGYFLEVCIQRISQHSHIIVIENDLELIKLAFSRDSFSEIGSQPNIHWVVGTDPEEIKQHLKDWQLDFAVNGYVNLTPPALWKNDEDYFQRARHEIDRHIQTLRLGLNTQQAFSKKLCKNILDNRHHILSSGKIQDLKDQHKDAPAIVVSAGPSLDKNIHLLNSAQSKAVIVSVPTALKALIQNEVFPDFTIALDPNDISMDAFDVPLPSETHLVFDPSLPPSITRMFEGRRWGIDSSLYLYQWMMQPIGSMGRLGESLSVAHAATYLAGHLGCNPIILIGQDLSFNGNRLHCSESHFSESQRLDSTRERLLDHYYNARYLDNVPSMKPATDLFGNETMTTLALESYSRMFERNGQRNIEIYNATEGGVPIPGITNVLLKEILNRRCAQHLDKWKPETGKSSAHSSQWVKIKAHILPMLEKLNHWKEKIQSLGITEVEGTVKKKAQQRQHQCIGEFLVTLQGDEEVHGLLQGYSPSHFIQWLQTTHAIHLQESRHSPATMERMIYERDLTFIKYLEQDLEGLARLLSETLEAERKCTTSDVHFL